MTAILYEVVITVDPEIRVSYLVWLKRHMKDMTALNGFASASLFINTENENEITCHYMLHDQQAMDAYLTGPAIAMRADGVKRFGDQFSARRRILTSKINEVAR